MTFQEVMNEYGPLTYLMIHYMDVIIAVEPDNFGHWDCESKPANMVVDYLYKLNPDVLSMILDMYTHDGFSHVYLDCSKEYDEV
jgi:hypothetical protein